MSTRPKRIAPPDLTLDGVLAWNAALHPEDFAIAIPDHPPVSWKTFELAVGGVAETIGAEFMPGETVGIVCNDSFEFHVVVNAAWRCGLSVLLISRSWGESVISDMLALTRSRRAYAWDPSQFPPIAGVECSQFPAVREPSSPSVSRSTLDHVAMFATTSGTTDNPKCVPIRHRQIRAAYRSALGVHNFNRVRTAASLFPLNGLGVMGICFLLPREVGAGTRVYPPFALANICASWNSVIDEADFVYLVPSLVRLLGTQPARSSERDNPLLVFCAAAPIDQAELRRLEQRFPVSAWNCYGLTELTFAVFFGTREPDGGASGSIGIPPPGLFARLVDVDGHNISGEGQGELWLTGPMLTEGYLGNPAGSAAMWRDGWLMTGDIARRDHSGRYTICGRIKDVVIRGGVLTYLHEIEHYLRQAPGVIDVVAFKGHDLASGDELCALVHAADLDRESLVAWSREHLGYEKVPNVFFMTDGELPRNSNGKIIRREIAQRYINGVLS